MRTIVIALAAMLCGAPLSAQWLSEPTRGIPRLPDGKPDLAAPAPRTVDGKPDFSGLWLTPLHPGYVGNIAADLDPADVQPQAARLFEERMGDFGKDDRGGLLTRAKFIQTPTLIVILYEDLAYRQIFMDGRALEPDPHPSFMGYRRTDFGHVHRDITLTDPDTFTKPMLIPLSNTTFSPRLLGTYEFVTDARGVVTHLVAQGVEGTMKAVRRR